MLVMGAFKMKNIKTRHTSIVKAASPIMNSQ